MSIVIYLCINMRKERFQVRISSNGFSETFFSLFNFHFSIFSVPRRTLFSIFTFQFSICIAPSANTLFNFQFSFFTFQFSLFNLYWYLGKPPFPLFTFQFPLFNFHVCNNDIDFFTSEHPYGKIICYET